MPSKVRTSTASRRFPLEPLLDLLPEDNQAAADALGVDPKTIIEWRRGQRQQFTDRMADRYAVRLGRHPANIWIDW